MSHYDYTEYQLPALEALAHGGGHIVNTHDGVFERCDILGHERNITRMLAFHCTYPHLISLPTTSVDGAAKVPQTEALFPHPNTHQLMPNTHQPMPNTHQLLVNLPADLRARIPSAGTKPRKETLRVLIRDLCAWRALSARDIASLLGGRDHKHLVREFLSPMVHDNVLAHTIPEMDNHPEQRYTVAQHTTTAHNK